MAENNGGRGIAAAERFDPPTLFFFMKILVAIAAAALAQLQSPEAVIECAKAVQDHNAKTDEVAAAIEAYGSCMNAGRIDACSAEFRQLEEVQGRYELLIERLRRHCPADQLSKMERGGG